MLTLVYTRMTIALILECRTLPVPPRGWVILSPENGGIYAGIGVMLSPGGGVKWSPVVWVDFEPGGWSDGTPRDKSPRSSLLFSPTRPQAASKPERFEFFRHTNSTTSLLNIHQYLY